MNLSSQGLSQIDSSRSESEHKIGGVALPSGEVGENLANFVDFFKSAITAWHLQYIQHIHLAGTLRGNVQGANGPPEKGAGLFPAG